MFVLMFGLGDGPMGRGRQGEGVDEEGSREEVRPAIGRRPGGVRIFAVCSGWGSARRGLWGSALALTLTQ